MHKQNIATQDPASLLQMLKTVQEITDSNMLRKDMSDTLKEGSAKLTTLLGEGIHDKKLTVFDKGMIYYPDTPLGEYKFARTDLCRYFHIFKNNQEAVAYLVAGGVVAPEECETTHEGIIFQFKGKNRILKFIEDFHKLFYWTTWHTVVMHTTDFTEALLASPHLKFCARAISRFYHHGSIAHHDETIRNSISFRNDPQAFMNDFMGSPEVSAWAIRSEDFFVVNANGVLYRWKEDLSNPPKWVYEDYQLNLI